MSAMSTAGKNADEMLRKLKIQYNSLRQAGITREMIEISSGARALKKRAVLPVGGASAEQEQTKNTPLPGVEREENV